MRQLCAFQREDTDFGRAEHPVRDPNRADAARNIEGNLGVPVFAADIGACSARCVKVNAARKANLAPVRVTAHHERDALVHPLYKVGFVEQG